MLRRLLGAAILAIVAHFALSQYPDTGECYTLSSDQKKAINVDCTFKEDKEMKCFRQVKCKKTCSYNLTSSINLLRSEGAKWFEMNNELFCECDEFKLPFGRFVEPLFPGFKWSMVKTCRDYGCRDSNMQYKKPGTVYYRRAETGEGGQVCSCVPGQDPNLADAATLFYWNCRSEANNRQCKRNGKSYSIGSNKEFVTRGVKEKCSCNWMNAKNMADFTCFEQGCRDKNWNFVEPMASLTQWGKTCKCVEGTDPATLDTSRKYYLKCGM